MYKGPLLLFLIIESPGPTLHWHPILHFPMYNPYMTSEIAFYSTSERTIRAGKWLLSRVCPIVPEEVALVKEGFATVRTDTATTKLLPYYSSRIVHRSCPLLAIITNALSVRHA
ncbi:unnamed protein product, partial [Meganyctiphanes norvegica]